MTKSSSAVKRLIATILAILTLFSGMAVSASAAGTPTDATPEKIVIPPPTVSEPNTTNKTITVKIDASYKGYPLEIDFSPAATRTKQDDGSYLYYNLVPGTTYTVRAYAIINDKTVYSIAVSRTLKKQQATPSAPVPSAVTSKSIKIVAVTGCEYKLSNTKGVAINGYGWGDKVLFEGLTADTAYVVSIRKKASGTMLASDAASVTVKTLKKGDAKAVAMPSLVDKTNNSITVAVKNDKGEAVTGVQYSIDKGKTWQTSGEFKNLNADTIYGIIARKVFDPAVQDPNPSSAVFETKTNTRAKYEASLSKCTFKLEEGKVYADEKIKAYATGDGPKDIYLAEYGDTRLIPYAVEIDGSGTFAFGRNNDVYTAEIIPGKSNANSKIVVRVVYNIQKYNGESWVKNPGTETITSSHEIEVGPENTILTKISEFFSSIGNLLLNTIPQFIANLMGNEMIAELTERLMELINGLGNPTTK